MRSLKMIEHELLLLGLLKESPKHGYEIKRRIREILFLFMGIDLKSIYYPLRVLEKKGLVTQRIDKAGRRPQRFVYELTKKGKLRFEELLAHSLLELKRPQFNLDLSLYFLNYIPAKMRYRRLRARIFMLNKIASGMREMLASPDKKGLPLSLSPILEHNLNMLEAETKFLQGLIKNPDAEKS
jgi:DNA-binding PadR family transcriptional regulator